jgi:hypothetical protein
MEAWQPIALMVAPVLSSIATAAAAYFAYMAIKQSVRGHESQVLFEIVRRHNEIYATRNRLFKMDFSWSRFQQKYPRIEDVLISDEYKALREVGACYELIGTLVKRKYVDLEPVLDLILVNPRSGYGDPAPSLWEHVSELIYKLGEMWNPDEWVNWEFLVKQEKRYLTTRKSDAHHTLIQPGS